MTNGRNIWVYQERYVNCNCEDDSICKKSPAACLFGGVIGVLGACVAPPVVIPALVLGGAAAAP
jgi:hypothetical protein